MKIVLGLVSVAALFGVSACVSDCICVNNACDCKWPQISVGDEICLRSADITECVPVQPTSPEDDEASAGMTDIGCVCSIVKCTCIWDEVPERSEICLNASTGMRCSPVEMNPTYVQVGDKSCKCNSVGCSCNFARVSKSAEICHESSTGIRCLPVQSSSLSDRVDTRMSTDDSNWCNCEGTTCFCNWRDVEDGDIICLKEPDVERCVLASRYVGEPIYSSGMECLCSKVLCGCILQNHPWKKEYRRAVMCHESLSGKECFGLERAGAPLWEHLFSTEQACACEERGCTCIFKEVHDGDEICLKTSHEQICGNAVRINVAPPGRECDCDKLGCLCKWVEAKEENETRTPDSSRKSKHCECDEKLCTCDLTTGLDGSRSTNNICVKQSGHARCIPASRLTKESGNRFYCTYEDMGYKCMWDVSQNITAICLKWARVEVCEKPKNKLEN